MMAAEAAIEIIGVSDSAATSIMASELGVTVEPMITSTLSSLTSLRAFFTAVVGSDRVVEDDLFDGLAGDGCRQQRDGVLFRDAERRGRAGGRHA